MNNSERLKKVINETANSSIAISVNEQDGFFTLVGNTKKRFSNQDLNLLCDEISTFIEKERKAKEVTNRSPKPFTL